MPGLRINTEVLMIFQDLSTFDFINKIELTFIKILEGYQEEKKERKLADFDTTSFSLNYIVDPNNEK